MNNKIPCDHCWRLEKEHNNRQESEWHWMACRAKGHPIEEPDKCSGYWPMSNLDYLEQIYESNNSGK